MGSFVLNLRWQDSGGGQRDLVLEEVRPAGSSCWLIFIHGFRNTRCEAIDHWNYLRDRCDFGGDDDRIDTGLLLWPSDAASYPRMLEPAEKAGRKLASYLSLHPGPDIVLVGYSLGALVALAAADALRGRMNLQGLVLLGAAVDVARLAPFAQYGFVPYARREAVAYSHLDSMLRKWFRVGERAAAPVADRGEAVGLWGRPVERGWRREDSRTKSHAYWQLPISPVLMRWALDRAIVNRAPAVHLAAECSLPGASEI